MRGAFAGGVFTVSPVTFRPGVAVVVRSEGPVTQVSASGGRFTLNGRVVSFSGTPTVQGSLDNLRKGHARRGPPACRTESGRGRD